MKGRIDEMDIKELDGGRKYASLVIEGEKYSLWDKKLMESLRRGDMIQYEWKQKGNYRNITEAESMGSPSENSNHNGGNGYDKKNRVIVRLSCLKSASEILSPAQIEIDKKRDMTLDTAKYFEKYVLEDPEFAK